MGAGRPSSYDPEIAADICSQISTSRLRLRSICDADERFPDVNTFYRWMGSHPELRELYARAKDDQLDLIEDEILEIADDSTNDFIEIQRKKGVDIIFDKEAVMRSNLRIESRKWLMGKLRPKKYGDRIQQDISGSLDIAGALDAARKRAEE